MDFLEIVGVNFE